MNSQQGTLADAMIYDPAMPGWVATGMMNVARQGHNAVLLGTGKVMVTGGAQLGAEYGPTSADIYTP